MILPEYGKPSDGKLFAAVEPQQSTHSQFDLFPRTTEQRTPIVLLGACGEFGPDLAVAVRKDGAASVGSEFDLDLGRQGVCGGQYRGDPDGGRDSPLSNMSQTHHRSPLSVIFRCFKNAFSACMRWLPASSSAEEDVTVDQPSKKGGSLL